MLKFFKTIFMNWGMIKTWALFNIQAKYIDTKLGIFWIAIQPIFQTLIYTFAFGTLLGRQPRGDVPFILFFLAGITPWSFINMNFMQAGQLFVKNMTLMDQVKVSKEAMIFVELIEASVDLFVNFVILILVAAVYGCYPNINYFYLPLLFAFIVLFSLGGMLFLSTIGVFFRDTSKIVSLILRILFFASGVIITPDMLSERSAKIIEMNPITTMLESIRNVILYSDAPTSMDLVYIGSIALLVYIVGNLVFTRYQGTFVDYK